MVEKINLPIIVLGLLCQCIIGTVSGENNEKSANLLIRNKRVLNMDRNGDTPASILDFPYVVNIKQNNRTHCVGSILSHQLVITAPNCVKLSLDKYQVFAGSDLASDGSRHQVINKDEHFSNYPKRVMDGVALLTVNPLFEYSLTVKSIQIHEGLLLPGTPATISGWGFRCGNQFGTSYPARLRAINVSIISHRECVINYRNIMQIFDSDVCTYHPQKHCGHTDPGAPLVVNRKLAGIHLWSGQIIHANKPDVFAIVQHSNYHPWIRSKINQNN